MVDVLNFARRKRPAKLAEELLALPCMSEAVREDVGAPAQRVPRSVPRPRLGADLS